MNPTPPAPAQPAIDVEKTHLARDLVHDRPLITCRFDVKGRYVFAASEDANILRWDLTNGEKAVLKGHESWPFALEVSPDGTSLISGGSEGTLFWWPTDAKQPTPSRRIEAHSGWINALAVCPQKNLLASCGNDRSVRLWSLTDGAPVAHLPGHEKPVYRVTFDTAGKHLLSADLQGGVIQWDLATFKEVRRLDASKLATYFAPQGVDYGGVRDFALSQNDAYLVCSGTIDASNPLGAVSTPANVVLDWKDGKLLQLQRPKEDIKGVGWGVRCHSSDFVISVSGGTSGGFLWFFKPNQTNEFFKVALGNTGRALDLAPDQRHVATAHHDGHLRVYGLYEKPKV